MRRIVPVLVLAAAAVFVGPAPASRADVALPTLGARECKRIAKQMVHYRQVQDMAEERGNELWASATVAQLDRLAQRWDVGCDHSDEKWAIWFNDALKTAGRMALRYFTMGTL